MRHRTRLRTAGVALSNGMLLLEALQQVSSSRYATHRGQLAIPPVLELASRRIPAEVQREVWKRDGGRCCRCGTSQQLEFDHIVPWFLGGSNTARNVQLLCRPHNRRKGITIGD